MNSEGNQSKEAPPLEVLVPDFSERIANIALRDIRELPDVTGELIHTGHKSFEVNSDNFSPGLYVDTSHVALKPLLEEPATLWFQPQDGKRITREASHNHVFFGQLWTSPKTAPDSGIHVAVKTVIDSNKKKREETNGLFGELAAFQYLGSLALPTFKPAGLLVHDKGASLLTHFDGPVATMDTIEWSELNHEERLERLGPAVDTLVMLHSHGIFHGDLWFRNVGFNEVGNTVIVDPELSGSMRDNIAELVDAPLLMNDEQKKVLGGICRNMMVDFSPLHDGIEREIINRMPRRIKPRNAEERLKLYKHHIYEPYKSRIRELGTPESRVLLLAYDEMLQKRISLARSGTI